MIQTCRDGRVLRRPIAQPLDTAKARLRRPQQLLRLVPCQPLSPSPPPPPPPTMTQSSTWSFGADKAAGSPRQVCRGFQRNKVTCIIRSFVMGRRFSKANTGAARRVDLHRTCRSCACPRARPHCSCVHPNISAHTSVLGHPISPAMSLVLTNGNF